MTKHVVNLALLTVSLLGLHCCQSGIKKVNEAEIAPATESSKNSKRVGMVTGLNPERAAYYKELHADAWDGVLEAIERYNIRNFSIYLKEIDDKMYLFSYYEYIGDDYEADMTRIAADATTQRWWRETDPCQLPLPEAAASGEIWTPMEEVFHTD